MLRQLFSYKKVRTELFISSQIQEFFFVRVESVRPAVTSSANWYLSQDIQRPIMRCTPAPPPSPRRPPAPPSVLGISYISFYRYRVKITNFLCSFMFWKTSAKRCKNRRKPKARAKLEENQRRFYSNRPRISLYGSSCNSLIFGLIRSCFRSLSISWPLILPWGCK